MKKSELIAVLGVLVLAVVGYYFQIQGIQLSPGVLKSDLEMGEIDLFGKSLKQIDLVSNVETRSIDFWINLDPANPLPEEDVTFSVGGQPPSPTSGNLFYYWVFDTGVYSYEPNPVKHFPEGLRTVNLTIYDDVTWLVIGETSRDFYVGEEGCVSDEDCSGQVCDVDSGACVDCLNNGDCAESSSRPYCDVDLNLCVECFDNLDCEDDFYCTGAGSCNEGSCEFSGNPCVDPLVCDESGERCVVCLTNSDCASGERCFLSDGNCYPNVCESNLDCPANYRCNVGLGSCMMSVTKDQLSDLIITSSDDSTNDFQVRVEVSEIKNYLCKSCESNSDCGSNYCEDGCCYERYCVDSDGGINPDVIGLAYYCYNGPTSFCGLPWLDSCSGSGVSEKYCDGEGIVASVEVPCSGTCFNGKCAHVECSDNLDCGSIVMGDPYCVGSLIAQDETSFVCNDPGRPWSSCSEIITPFLIDNCDNHLFCDGQESCVDANCFSGEDPCPGQECNELNDLCVGSIECYVDEDCGELIFGGLYCSNNAIFRDESSPVCNEPGLPFSYCSEKNVSQMIGNCSENEMYCNSMPLAHCVNCLDSSHCDNGLFCDGAESCSGGNCLNGVSPCSGQECDEELDACVECLDNDDCIGNPNGELCNLDEYVCVECFSSLDCEDNLYCTGTENCNSGFCESSGNPCLAGYVCNETGDSCDVTSTEFDIILGGSSNGIDNIVSLYENITFSAINPPDYPEPYFYWQLHTPYGSTYTYNKESFSRLFNNQYNHLGEWLVELTVLDFSSPYPYNFSYINKTFSVEILCLGGCNDLMGHPPFCDPVSLECVNCIFNGQCGSSVAPICNLDINECVECLTNVDCIGNEDGELCDEAIGRCVECSTDLNCDNGIFCDGNEYCVEGDCRDGLIPCSGQECDEAGDRCVECMFDNDCIGSPNGGYCDIGLGVCVECFSSLDCEDNLYCTGVETCNEGSCESTGSPCNAPLVCDENNNGACVVCLDESDCGTDGFIGGSFCVVNDVYQNYTNYTCNNPGLSSSCSNVITEELIHDCPQICENGACNFVCENDEDCGLDGISEETHCFDGEVYKRNYTYNCMYPGQEYSYCDDYFSRILYQNCSATSQFCHEGNCVTCASHEDCGSSNLVGNSFCVDGNLHKNVSVIECVNPGTSESYCGGQIIDGSALIDDCGDTCVSGACLGVVCNSDAECGSDSYGRAYCGDDGNVYHDHSIFSCLISGTVHSRCVEEIVSEIVSECSSGCIAGECRNSFTCSQDSDCGIDGYYGEPYCTLSDHVAKIYRDYSCDGGTCSFNETTEFVSLCKGGCADGICMPESCLSDSDCGVGRFRDLPKWCGNGSDVYGSYVDFSCLNPGTDDSRCEEKNSYRLFEDCEKRCLGGECLPESCSSDADCGLDFVAGSSCQFNDLSEDYIRFVCREPGTSESYCWWSASTESSSCEGFTCEEGACTSSLVDSNSFEWLYGSLSNNQFTDFVETVDGGYLAIGMIERLGVIVKLDSLGETCSPNLYTCNGMGEGGIPVFVKRINLPQAIGGYGNVDLYSIDKADDGGFIIGGALYSNITSENSFDFYFIKTDEEGKTCSFDKNDLCSDVSSTGKKRFARRYSGVLSSGSGGDSEEIRSVIQLDDGYVLVGSANSPSLYDSAGYVIKTNLDGETCSFVQKGSCVGSGALAGTYVKRLDSDITVLYDGVRADGNNFVVVGDYGDSRVREDFISKLSGSGNIIWTRGAGDGGHDTVDRVVNSAGQVSGYIVAGGSPVRIVKYNSNGYPEFDKDYSDFYGFEVGEISSVDQTFEAGQPSGFVFAGNGPDSIFKTNNDGDTCKVLGNDLYCYNASMNGDSVFVKKINPNGISHWTNFYETKPNRVRQLAEDYVFVGGFVKTEENLDAWMGKFQVGEFLVGKSFMSEDLGIFSRVRGAFVSVFS